MKVIVIQGIKGQFQQVIEYLEKTLKAELILLTSATSAVGMIDLFDDIELVISPMNISKEETGQKLIVWKNRGNGPIGLKYYLEGHQVDDAGAGFTFFNNESELLYLLSKLSSLDKITLFSELPISLFEYFTTAPADIYIRLNKLHEQKMIKRFNEGDLLSSKSLERYKKKGLKHFFYQNADKDKVLKIMNKAIVQSVLNPIEKMNSTDQVKQNVIEDFKNLKMNLEVLNESMSHSNNLIKALKENSDLYRSVGLATRKNFNVKFKKMYSTLILGVAMLSKYSWAKKEHFEYFTLATFLKDNELSKESYFKGELTHDLNIGFKDLKVGRRVHNHAQVSAMNLKEFDFIPSEVIKIVMQHHGSLNGIGCPRALSQQVSPIAKTLLCCDEFSTRVLLKNVATNSAKSHFIGMNEKFSNGCLSGELSLMSPMFS